MQTPSTSSSSPIPVGIIGLGRSGWNIHARMIDMLPEHYRVVCVADHNADRRAEAATKFGCRTTDDEQALIDDAQVALVVIASPSHLHGPHAQAALAAGKHVIVEKPLAGTTTQVDELMTLAQRKQCMLAPFQNLRFDPLLRLVREAAEEGNIGRPVKVTCCFHKFARRWDWQTLTRFDGGELRNTGIHALDQAMEFLGDPPPGGPELFSHMDRALSSGDAEDVATLVLRGKTGPLVMVEVGSCFAMPRPRWEVVGTQGTIISDADHRGITIKWTCLEDLPRREVDTTITAERSYNSEQYDWQEASHRLTGDEPDSRQALYLDVHAHLTRGTPLTVTAESVRQRIAVIERCGIYGDASIAEAHVQ